MTTIDLTAIATTNESTAVAAGRAIIAALESRNEIDIEDTGDTCGEDVWSELTDYLARRNVTLRDGVAYPAAQ